ncbi:MAG: phasin family protein [Thauera sp.]|nr:phasin family protein [Thauera sp.]
MTTHPAYLKLAETAHSNIEQLQAYALIGLDASEKLLALNFGAARALCDSVVSAPTGFAGTDLHETLAKQVAAQSRGLEELGDYLRRITEVCAEAQSDMVEHGNRHLEQVQTSMNALLEEARKLAPAGTLELNAEPAARGRATRKAA